MVRAFVFYIVLLMGIGQEASLLCSVWCHSNAGALAECGTQANSGTTPNLTGKDSCERTAADATILLREDARRIADQHAHHAAAVPRQHLLVSSSDSHLNVDSTHTPTTESRARNLALRI